MRPTFSFKGFLYANPCILKGPDKTWKSQVLRSMFESGGSLRGGGRSLGENNTVGKSRGAKVSPPPPPPPRPSLSAAPEIAICLKAVRDEDCDIV